MRILILDDMEPRHETFRKNLEEHDRVHVYSYDEAVKAVTEGERFDVFYLDHDLMDFHYEAYNAGYVNATEMELTGYTFVLWMISTMELSKRPELVVVHSWNDTGAARMAKALSEDGFNVVVEEFNLRSGKTLEDNRNG